MKILPFILRTVLPRSTLLLAAAAAVSGSALDGLQQGSPFNTTAGNTASPGAGGGAVEFRGIITTGDGVLLGFFDHNSGQSFWVPANAGPTPTGPLVVRTYDAAHDQVKVEYQGRLLTLTLIDAIIGVAEPLPAPAPFDPAATNPAAPPDPVATKQAVDELMQRRAQRQTIDTSGSG